MGSLALATMADLRIALVDAVAGCVRALFLAVKPGPDRLRHSLFRYAANVMASTIVRTTRFSTVVSYQLHHLARPPGRLVTRLPLSYRLQQ
jgi:hypothetical protein